MVDKQPLRYLLGGGEKLSSDITKPRRAVGDKNHPYSFEEAVGRLSPQWEALDEKLDALPSLAKPNGEAVVGFTLHPSYLAKSYYPADLLAHVGLRHVGSRAVHLRPEKVVTERAKDDPRPMLAPLIYAAGEVKAIRRFSRRVAQWQPGDNALKEDFRKIEEVALPGRDRLKGLTPALKARKGLIPVEVVLHVDSDDDDRIVSAFERFVAPFDVDLLTDRRRTNGGLCFLPARAKAADLSKLLDFSFLRALRGMPTLRTF